ncbi:NUDIX domain-containing protein [Promineifilum sp.]|uniref:NUDIX domain-containing protein n=1 Tax=Promineifilum sp. TaxID=2664178 RepID=UPI0035B124B8
MSRRDFADPAALEAWLRGHGLPLDVWGQGRAKRVADLWAECAAGETTLHDDPLQRRVRVAQVLIRRGERLLIEVEQEMTDGRRRARLLPPSEKLKGEESPLAAAARCLAEELGLAGRDVKLRELGQPARRVVDSPSYPGLPTIYLIYTVEATADALPEADFWRDNVAQGDVVRRHLWGWRGEQGSKGAGEQGDE